MRTRIIQQLGTERSLPNGRFIPLELRAEGRTERVPAILLLPDSTARSAAVVLLHGYSSRKEQMADTLGQTLLRHSIASLAIDLPLHGERLTGEHGVERGALSNPMTLVSNWQLALSEVQLALGYLSARREIASDCLGLVGYSMGSFLAVQVASTSRLVQALVLAAGGDLPEGTPFARLIRLSADPLRAVRRLDGKPLLMVHGRHDPTVTPQQAQRLFDAAMEPKTIRWWNSGHYLPKEAIDDAAKWLEEQLRA